MGFLSTYDGDQITAERAWIHFTTILQFHSVGSYAVSVHECGEIELPVKPDPEPFPEHVLIDFNSYSGNQIEKKAKKLKVYAEARGWQYQST